MVATIAKLGTGPIDHALLRNADKCVRRFRRELGLAEVSVDRAPDLDHEDGRYHFILRYGPRETVVAMPGITVERVRYRLHSEDDTRDFSRLYVDGNSWLWPFALHNARATLVGEG